MGSIKYKYKTFNEVVVSDETTTINALNYVKNIIYNNIDKNTINKLSVEYYCNYCKDKIISKTVINFNKLIIKNKKDYSCNLPEVGTKKEKIKLNDLSNSSIRLDKSSDVIINTTSLQCLFYVNDIICIPLSPYYLLDDFYYYKDGFKIIFNEVYKKKNEFIGIDIIFESNELNGGEPVVSNIIKLR